jgi:L-ribulose-5-phosphate 3-epimerase
MNPVSFMTANFVARQLGYNMTGGWGEGEKSVMTYFRPVNTYPARFARILDDICHLGFNHIDLWLAHLSPDWATNKHIDIAQHALARRGMKVSSLAGWFGGSLETFEQCCRIAHAVDTRILGGMTSLVRTDREGMVKLLEKYDLVLAIENHPEKTPAEVLEQIGDTGRGRIGTCIDTGIWATQCYDAAQAVEELGQHIFYVHLKDVLRLCEHESCRYGRGIVPLQECVRKLQGMGYTGGYSVEHEPIDYDPSEDVQVSGKMLRGWLELLDGKGSVA